ncbi:hypothetical protein RT21_20015 [Pseudomonas sp. 10B238]|uniref:hypothetical protein n=1 Tax=Pseudomonas sp. 10B238 TaxID=1586417 RepID=UPI0006181464|nr:hypothetical protein [Pseudomonas sp. 10B238]KJJ61527.1 hypothetical protein RT21_20015 [Pseudomonas sp. 10B238]
MNALVRGQRRREPSLPADNTTLEEAIRDQLDEHDEATVQAFIDYCDDRIDDFLEHEANRRREHAEEIRRDAA